MNNDLVAELIRRRDALAEELATMNKMLEIAGDVQSKPALPFSTPDSNLAPDPAPKKRLNIPKHEIDETRAVYDLVVKGEITLQQGADRLGLIGTKSIRYRFNRLGLDLPISVRKREGRRGRVKQVIDPKDLAEAHRGMVEGELSSDEAAEMLGVSSPVMYLRFHEANLELPSAIRERRRRQNRT